MRSRRKEKALADLAAKANGKRESTVAEQLQHSAKANRSKADKIAESLCALFDGNETGHWTFGGLEKDDRGLFRCDNVTVPAGPPTVLEWREHLYGTTGLGIAPIKTDGTTKFACIDLDDHNSDPSAPPQFDQIDIVGRIRAKKLPLNIVLSKNGGLHLFVFFNEPVAAVMARRILRSWASALGFPNAEIFPKQDVVGADGRGSNLWMPYYGFFAGKELPCQVAINATGGQLLPDEFAAEAKHRTLTAKDWDVFLLLAGEEPNKFRRVGQPAAPHTEDRGPRAMTKRQAKGYLTKSCEMIRAAKPGERNNIVTERCLIPGRAVGGELLDDEETWDALEKAIRANPDHDQKMLERGRASYQAGKLEPLELATGRVAQPDIDIANFRMEQDGLLYSPGRDQSGEPVWHRVSQAFEILGRCRTAPDASGRANQWGLAVHYRDADGRSRDEIIPAEE
jgi:hypothetical protein